MSRSPVGKQVIMRMIRKMQNGLFIGEGVLVLGLTFWFSWTPYVGIPVCVIAIGLLYISLRYVIKARLMIRRMEKSGEAQKVYKDMEKNSCIMSPQTNTIISDNYVISSGVRSGFEIIRSSYVIRFWQNDYENRNGYTRDIILITKDMKKHYAAFYNSRTPIPEAYQEVVDLLRQRLINAEFGREKS